jgi:hypothetical protein
VALRARRPVEAHKERNNANGGFIQLTPFVVKKVGKYVQGDREDEWSVPKEKLTGQEYLDMWKDAGGHDIVEYTPEPANEGKK